MVQREGEAGEEQGAHFTRFTSTKVQILTQTTLLDAGGQTRRGLGGGGGMFAGFMSGTWGGVSGGAESAMSPPNSSKTKGGVQLGSMSHAAGTQFIILLAAALSVLPPPSSGKTRGVQLGSMSQAAVYLLSW